MPGVYGSVVKVMVILFFFPGPSTQHSQKEIMFIWLLVSEDLVSDGLIPRQRHHGGTVQDTKTAQFQTTRKYSPDLTISFTIRILMYTKV